jgi:integrase
MSNRKKRGRRARGEGGVRWREDKKMYVGEVRLPNGKRPTVYGRTEAEVREKMDRRRSEFAAGITGEANSMELRQWLDRWLVLVKPTIEPNTYVPYERHCRLHIKPYLGVVKLAKLRRVHLQTLYAELAKAGVSAALQRKVATTMTIALNDTVDQELLVANPLASRRSRRSRKPKATRPEIHPLDPDQVATFLAGARSDRLFSFYRTALDSGARPGELFALLWQDVDFERGRIFITKSLEEIAGKLRVKETKTARSRRHIDLSAETLAALAEHRKAMLAAGFINGPVFCNSRGTYLRLTDLRVNSFKPILKQAGLPDIRLYDLRHTCATLLLLADVSPEVVSERLGHSTVTLTLDTYSHVLPTMQKKAADLMGQLLGQKPRGEIGGTMAVQGGGEEVAKAM